MKQLLIVGASGHGKVVADIAELNGYDSILFFDDNETLKKCGKHTVVGYSSDIDRYEGDIIVAIGNAEIRSRIQDSVASRNFPTLIHPSAVISPSAQIGSGTVVMANAVINADAVVGKGCINQPNYWQRLLFSFNFPYWHPNISTTFIHISNNNSTCTDNTTPANTNIIANCRTYTDPCLIADINRTSNMSTN